MTIKTLLGFILLAIGLQQHSADLAGLISTCQNEAMTEGETGHMTYSINPNIPIHDDPHAVIFIKQYQATGNIIRCRRPYNGEHVECKVSDHRFQSDGLNGTTIFLRVPNATWSLQGHYELHVVANGTFHPTTSCYLAVHNKTGLNPEDRETINVVLIVVPLAVCLLVLSSVLFIMLYIRRLKKRLSCCSGFTERFKSTTRLDGVQETKSAHSLPDLNDSGKGGRETIPSACDVPELSENLISLNDEEVPDEKDSKDDADIKIDEEVPSSSADKVNSGTNVAHGAMAIIGNMFSSSVSAAYSTLGKLINSNTSEESGVNPIERVAMSSVYPDTQPIGNANENSDAFPEETEASHLDSQLSLEHKSDQRDDERSEEPTERNGLLQNNQEPSVTKPPKNPGKIVTGCEEAQEVHEDMFSDEPVMDLAEATASKETDATSTALPIQETGQSVCAGASGSPGADYHVCVAPNKVSSKYDFTSALAEFNKRAKQRQSEKREENKVASPGAGTSQSVQKSDVGISAPSIASYSTPYPVQPFSYNRSKQPHKTTDDLHINHHTTFESTV